jgi:ABC-2 type transport system ATP-binding protein
LAVVQSSGTGVVVHVRTPNVTELTTAVTGRGGTVTATSDGRLRITGVSAAAVGNAAAIGVELHDLRTHRAYLGDVFLELTGGQAAIR